MRARFDHFYCIIKYITVLPSIGIHHKNREEVTCRSRLLTPEIVSGGWTIPGAGSSLNLKGCVSTRNHVQSIIQELWIFSV